ncbi:MAG: aldo/keto reductase [Crocinitomicaceae bacterium]|nr:aldo/keto reductase [Crocinitomicaceae bacterium]
MVKFSRIVAGTMRWGKWGKNFTTQEYIERIETSVNNSITTFDHADIYGDYTTEIEFGNAFQLSSMKREHVQFISKCGIQYPCENNASRLKHYDYSKQHIRQSVEKSLINLKTDYLDALLLHRPSPLMNSEEIGEVISELKNEGKLLHLGVSNFTQTQIELIEKHTVVEINQIECSLSQLNAMKNGLLDAHQVKSILTMAWRPLGLVFENNSNIKTSVLRMANDYGCSADVLLLAWLLKHPASIHPVIGTSNLERIAMANKALEIEMSTEDWFGLFVESQGHMVP